MASRGGDCASEGRPDEHETLVDPLSETGT